MSTEKKLAEDAQLSFGEFPLPSYEEWRNKAEQSLKGGGFEEQLYTKTYEGITLHPLYRKEDVRNIAHLDSLPGMAPYVRGTTPSGYVGRPWQVAQEIKASSPTEANHLARRALERGQTMLNFCIDQSLSWKEASLANLQKQAEQRIPLFDVADLEALVEGIDLDKYPLYISAGALSEPVIHLLKTALERQGKGLYKVAGTIGADPLGVLAKEGTLLLPLEKIYASMAQLISLGEKEAPQLKTVLIDTQIYHHGGANAVQELAFALATGVEYLRHLQDREIDLNLVTKQMTFSFSIGTQFFMEIAKIRAARLLWSQVVQAFGGTANTQKMNIHGRTSAWNKSKLDPHVNILRSTSEALAAVLGGVDSLHVSSFNDVLNIQDEFSQRIARNTQLILEQEVHLAKIIDPVGGSWYIEHLTEELAHKAWQLFQKIESLGGMFQALQAEFPQQQVAKVRALREENIAERKDRLVGTNMYANIRESFPSVSNKLRVIELVDNKSRDESGEQSSGKIKEENNVEQGHAHQPLPQVTKIEPYRVAEPFEQLRAQAERYRQQHGSLPKVFLVNFGELPQYKARADFATGFFEVGGFEVLNQQSFTAVEEALKAAFQAGTKIITICSTDKMYTEIVSLLAKQLKDRDPELTLFVAGKPTAEEAQTYRAAGVDEFIHMHSNCLEVLQWLQKVKGVAP